ncbi:MAG: hypothetical protein H0V82_11565 [Candidatus Protochlamydia sp.]|nr:hypothetical protein [Candidatus Protochlamydia sp.]
MHIKSMGLADLLKFIVKNAFVLYEEGTAAICRNFLTQLLSFNPWAVEGHNNKLIGFKKGIR